MRKREVTKLIQEGGCVAQVDVELIEIEDGWSLYLSLEDAYKLDEVRDALRRGDLSRAAQLSWLLKLTPVAA